MSSLTKEKVQHAFEQLRKFMANPDLSFESAIATAQHYNAWFTAEEIKKAIASLGNMLNRDDLDTWLDTVKFQETTKKVGLILAGNIPLVGFHDVICVLATGNIALIKMSSSDDKLLPKLLDKLAEIEPAFAQHIHYVEKLADFDAIIATGSNNTSRYFDYYFSKVPNIIRRNRNSVAILTGEETTQELKKLGHDIFDYFGLGCRNVSKIFVPKHYDFKHFFESIEEFQPIINHFKYNNNYDYNKSIYLINAVKHFDNGFLLVKADNEFVSPLATLFYEEYNSIDEVNEKLEQHQDQLQCIVSDLENVFSQKVIGFGDSQQPKLWDYADHVNTIEFLNSL